LHATYKIAKEDENVPRRAQINVAARLGLIAAQATEDAHKLVARELL
jgi:hypothetical protein